jgi:hypothetical protein
MSQVNAATISADVITPVVASTLITHFCFARSSRLMCSAPANSRKLNIPCMSVSLKSMAPNSSSARRSRSNPTLLRPIKASDITSEISISPTVVGSLR